VRLKFGLAVRELRLKQGLSQEALAKAAQLSRTYLTGVETGRRNPTLHNISRLADALGVPIRRLFRVSSYPDSDPAQGKTALN
jgi:transcriptional regulator with XRE-family HTH domain